MEGQKGVGVGRCGGYRGGDDGGGEGVLRGKGGVGYASGVVQAISFACPHWENFCKNLPSAPKNLS